MQYPSADVLAQWPAANYVDPVTQGYRQPVVTVLFLSIAVLIVGTRTFTRLCITKSFGLDDTFAILALVPATAYAVIALLANMKYNCDRHIWDVPVEFAILNQKFTWIVHILFAFATCFTKLSMLVLISKMVLERPHRIATYMSMALVVSSSFTFIVTVIFQCWPISEYWTLSHEPQQCFNESANVLSAGIINTITDFCVVLVPIPIVWRLNMTFQLRLSIALLFATSFFVCIASIVRTIYTYKFNNSYDKTWDGYNVYLTASLELFVGIICCSIPPIKPFIKFYCPSLFPSVSTPYARSTAGQNFSRRQSNFDRKRDTIQTFKSKHASIHIQHTSFQNHPINEDDSAETEINLQPLRTTYASRKTESEDSLV